MAKISGGCLCGAVRYESSGDVLGTSVCHCTHCQQVSGSAFSVNVRVPVSSVSLTGDGVSTYTDTADSGNKVERTFCGRCGSSIASEPASMPGVFIIKAGTLDDRSWLKPETHIWTRSSQPWVVVPEGVARFDKGRT